MIESTSSIRLFSSVSVVLALLVAGVAQARQLAEVRPHIVEVFTTTQSPVMGETVVNRLVVQGEMEFHVYDLDGIQRIEAQLSEGLTADPEHAKRVVLQRFQQLHEEDRAQMQRAAMGLAKAMQYGIDCYPAIVFDGEVAVYGVTDIGEGLHRYQRWREGRTR